MLSKLPKDHPAHKARTCKKCGEFKQPSEFSVHKRENCYHGYQAVLSCKSCEKDRKLRSHLETTYGITLEDYEEMVEEQDNKCLLCDQPPSDVYNKLVVDHCHKTGKVRGLLCRSCNVFLAKIEGCDKYFEKVKDYLK